jgi:hypothetical protein
MKVRSRFVACRHAVDGQTDMMKLTGTFGTVVHAPKAVHIMSFTNLCGRFIHIASEFNSDVDTRIHNYYITERRDLDKNIFVI